MRPAIRHRIPSLDVFRGLAVAAMIVVNNPGDWNAVLAPLQHAHWNGFTPADAVFPSFVFIIGVTLPLSSARRVAGEGRAATLRHIVRRTLLLIGLGLALNLVEAGFEVDRVRVPGVLQRIALAYAIAAPVVTLTRPGLWIVSAVVLLAAHTWLLLFVPFGEHAAGVLTPADNASGAIDAWLFGPRHLLTPTLDPEGMIGTLSTAATLLCGALADRLLRGVDGDARRPGWLVGGAVFAIGAGWAGAHWLPLNKSLWTATFAVASAGVAGLLFAGCAAMVDGRRAHWWTRPFEWLGVNPLAIYFLSELARHLLDIGWLPAGAGAIGVKDLVYWQYVQPGLAGLDPAAASLAFGVGVALVWIGVAGILDRRQIRLRL